MDAGLVVYEKPTCTTCRETVDLVARRGVDFERISYQIDGTDEEKLRELLGKVGLCPREAMRVKEPLYRKLGLEASDHSDDELVALIVEHPDLLQRPIVERGDRAVLARRAERVLELLD